MIHFLEAHTPFIKKLVISEDVLFTSLTSNDVFREATRQSRRAFGDCCLQDGKDMVLLWPKWMENVNAGLRNRTNSQALFKVKRRLFIVDSPTYLLQTSKMLLSFTHDFSLWWFIKDIALYSKSVVISLSTFHLIQSTRHQALARHSFNGYI